MRQPKIGIIIRKCQNVVRGDKNCNCKICTGEIPAMEAAENHGKFVESMLKLTKEGQY